MLYTLKSLQMRASRSGPDHTSVFQNRPDICTIRRNNPTFAIPTSHTLQTSYEKAKRPIAAFHDGIDVIRKVKFTVICPCYMSAKYG